MGTLSFCHRGFGKEDADDADSTDLQDNQKTILKISHICVIGVLFVSGLSVAEVVTGAGG
jgi:hypothetical protein